VKEQIKLNNLSIEETNNIIPPHMIMLNYRGSIAHGTYVPQEDKDSIDDKDILGICFAEPNVYLGLHNFEQKEKKYKEWDSVVYEIRKAFRLLLKQNPNILSLLWVDDIHRIYTSEVGKLLLENRDMFSSKQAYHSFVGYAYSQLHRMEHCNFNGYMGAKRKALVERFGFDVKNACHLIRLLRMGIEFLTEGRLIIARPDAEELKEIKKGKWTLQQVKKESDHLFDLAKEAYVRSDLPPRPDYYKAEEILISIIRNYLYLM